LIVFSRNNRFWLFLEKTIVFGCLFRPKESEIKGLGVFLASNGGLLPINDYICNLK
jgi:hypothetical protein